ncbi:response regulator [Salmonella enterica]|nr:response regulator [Salmonella enterica subsp. enterica]EEE4266742.1 response regulator [Salmonella enterica subsp. enterica serovar Sandiego]EJW2128684.1 response regulator [Salmonella enterica]EKT1704576.1 response regulator [Salmonella enterica]ELC6906961.1 response regulator [Salmonella enterica]
MTHRSSRTLLSLYLALILSCVISIFWGLSLGAIQLLYVERDITAPAVQSRHGLTALSGIHYTADREEVLANPDRIQRAHALVETYGSDARASRAYSWVTMVQPSLSLPPQSDAASKRGQQEASAALYILVVLLLLVTLVGLLYLVLQHNLNMFTLQIEGGDEVRSKTVCRRRSKFNNRESGIAELEFALRQAEQASANKNEHLNIISHEIRTPLNSIIGTFTLLGSCKTSVEHRELIDIGLNCSRHLLEIINNMLDLSRLNSGQMVVMTEPFDPLPIIEQTIQTVRVLAIEKGLNLHCQLEDTFPLQLHTDKLRLSQILINLLGNAVKFTAEGEVRLRCWSEEDKVCFRVTDSGPGIPMACHDDVFTSFHQINSHTAGSGLGLPIARNLARLLGGELFLEPVPCGASFRLELSLGKLEDDLEGKVTCYQPERPRRRMKSESRSNDLLFGEQMPTSPWSLQILFVDDVETNRDIVGRMLRQQGHQVYLATSGSDALLLGREHVFDLVLMDIHMPGLSGEEILYLWRDEGNGILDPYCPVMALTANAQLEERQRLLQVGFNEHLTKPVTPLMLFYALDCAANMQLERGAELLLNQGGAILIENPQLRTRLASAIDTYLTLLEEALVRGEMQVASQLLHTLKGLAGQGGLTLVHEACRQLEKNIKDSIEVTPPALNDLHRLIRECWVKTPETPTVGPSC